MGTRLRARRRRQMEQESEPDAIRYVNVVTCLGWVHLKFNPDHLTSCSLFGLRGLSFYLRTISSEHYQRLHSCTIRSFGMQEPTAIRISSFFSPLFLNLPCELLLDSFHSMPFDLSAPDPAI